jgi:hypothetical protein
VAPVSASTADARAYAKNVAQVTASMGD